MFARVMNWFLPDDDLANRTDAELASVFVFTHVFGPLLAQPMWIYLIFVTPGLDWPVAALIAATAVFWILPFVLRYTGRIWPLTLISFQLLTMTTLFAAQHYGGFGSPFMPWLVVSLLLGLFYHSRNAVAVVAVFCVTLLVWIAAFDFGRAGSRIAADQLAILSALSFASATIYVTWMAHCYARIVGLRAELEEEAERSQAVYADLQEARSHSETAIKIRARFFSKIGHELRTPLNAIIGYADLLMEDLCEDEARNAGRLKDLTRIMAAARHLMSLFSQVLDTKSIEGKEEILDLTSFDVGTLCDELVATSSHLTTKNRNRLVVTCKHREERLCTDATKLRQILINLMSNASKFTSDGVIKLEVDLVSQDGDTIFKAAVSDTGIGMSQEALSKIFAEYEQADETTTRRFGGTGIGLSLSRHLCHLLGGEIMAVSRQGQGSSFTVWIPARHPESQTATAANDKIPTRSASKISDLDISGGETPASRGIAA